MPNTHKAEFNSVLALLNFPPASPEDLDVCDLASAMLERAERITADFSDRAASQQVVKECNTILQELSCKNNVRQGNASALDLITGIREAALDCIHRMEDKRKKTNPVSRAVL